MHQAKAVAAVDGAILVGVFVVYVLFLAVLSLMTAVKDKTMKDAGVKLGQGRDEGIEHEVPSSKVGVQRRPER